jgi:hypothetical protein
VAVRIEHERAGIIQMKIGADAGRAVIASAGCHGRSVEGANSGAIPGKDCDMQGLVQSAFAADPEIRFAIGTKAGRGVAVGLLLCHFHDAT